MKKQNIIKKNKEFSQILNKRKKYKNKYFSIYYQPNKNITRFGISIPKKVGSAVTRNKLKRRIKNIIDQNKNSIQKYYDYVIIIKKGLETLSYQEIEKEFLNLIIKIGEK